MKCSRASRVVAKTLFLISTLGLGAAAISQELPRPIVDGDYAAISYPEALLGRALFYDPILSGNKTVACATCHHPDFGTSDGVSLSIGDGGFGLGPDRRIEPDNPPEKRIPRNSPALFNLGAREFTVMFHDGRLEASDAFEGGLRTPLDADMVRGFASVLSAQTMFPVLSRDEMAGSYNENEVGRAVRQGLITGEGGAWELLSSRVASIPEYNQQFVSVYSHIMSAEDIAFTDISNAIAAFIEWEWRSDSSPFDALLRGELQFSGPAQNGLELFYGRAGCSTCHSGPFLTDHKFHAMGAPQIGPGKAATFETHQRDEGRFRVTGATSDLYAFRTPSLRNVTLTGPYGHAGAHRDLKAFLASHAYPSTAIENYVRDQAILASPKPEDFAVLDSAVEREKIRNAVSWSGVSLTADDIHDLAAFLDTLTDPVAISGRLGVPDTVPSGLAVPHGLATR